MKEYIKNKIRAFLDIQYTAGTKVILNGKDGFQKTYFIDNGSKIERKISVAVMPDVCIAAYNAVPDTPVTVVRDFYLYAHEAGNLVYREI